jgi:hypothetical protein
MLTIGGLRVRDGEHPLGFFDLFIPDLEDPATLGCLLALVREAYGSEYVHAEAHEFDEERHNFWCVWAGAKSFEADTEVEALVAALEAAP